MEKDEANKIILLPDYQTLIETIERMKTELSMLLLERDELQFVVCKNIETAYCLELGALEYRAFEAQCAALRLKRKVEMIQARLNRQEKVDIVQIEQALDDEFIEFQKRLQEQIEKMNEALKRSKSKTLTDEETKELKKLYRIIVKSLHPDINPGISQAQLSLLDNAVAAYKDGDLVALRILEEMIADHKLPEQARDAMRALVQEKERLEGMLSSVRDSIGEIKLRYPYTVKEVVEDPEKKRRRKTEIEHMLAQYERMIEAYAARLEEMLR